MLKIKDFKLSIIALLLAVLLLFSACDGVKTGNADKSNSNNKTQSGDALQDGNDSTENGDSEEETLKEIGKKHVDKDDNGKCDKCKKSVLIISTFLQ